MATNSVMSSTSFSSIMSSVPTLSSIVEVEEVDLSETSSTTTTTTAPAVVMQSAETENFKAHALVLSSNYCIYKSIRRAEKKMGDMNNPTFGEKLEWAFGSDAQLKTSVLAPTLIGGATSWMLPFIIGAATAGSASGPFLPIFIIGTFVTTGLCYAIPRFVLAVNQHKFEGHYKDWVGKEKLKAFTASITTLADEMHYSNDTPLNKLEDMVGIDAFHCPILGKLPRLPMRLGMITYDYYKLKEWIDKNHTPPIPQVGVPERVNIEDAYFDADFIVRLITFVKPRIKKPNKDLDDYFQNKSKITLSILEGLNRGVADLMARHQIPEKDAISFQRLLIKRMDLLRGIPEKRNDCTIF